MRTHQIIIDTNVLVTALRSKQGASYKLLSIIDSNKFQLNISVPLLFEYEDVLKRDIEHSRLTALEIEDILDYICSIANKRKVFFLWRPFLKDLKDDFILELAVESNADYIVTYNKNDFTGIQLFGISTITPKEFLTIIEELP